MAMAIIPSTRSSNSAKTRGIISRSPSELARHHRADLPLAPHQAVFASFQPGASKGLGARSLDVFLPRSPLGFALHIFRDQRHFRGHGPSISPAIVSGASRARNFFAEPSSGEVVNDLRQRMFDLFRAGIVGEPASDAQSCNSAALI